MIFELRKNKFLSLVGGQKWAHSFCAISPSEHFSIAAKLFSLLKNIFYRINFH